MPGIFDFIGKVFKPGNFLENAGKIVDDLTMSAEEKAELKLKIEQAHRDHEIKLMELASTELQTYLSDVQDARDMQKVALQQDDRFAKRFVYYLAALCTVLAFATFGVLVFVEIPAANRDIAYMGAGAILSGCLVTIMNYFFGSSRGSDRKMEILDKTILKQDGTQE